MAFEQSFATPEEKSEYFRRLAFRSGYVRRQRRIERLVAELAVERAKLRNSCRHRSAREGQLCSYCGADVTA